jgi:ribonuclease HI
MEKYRAEKGQTEIKKVEIVEDSTHFISYIDDDIVYKEAKNSNFVFYDNSKEVVKQKLIEEAQKTFEKQKKEYYQYISYLE